MAGTQTVAQAVVGGLLAEGVETIFGIAGSHVLAIYAVLRETPQIRHVTTRHENGAASTRLAAPVHASCSFERFDGSSNTSTDAHSSRSRASATRLRSSGSAPCRWSKQTRWTAWRPASPRRTL